MFLLQEYLGGSLGAAALLIGMAGLAVGMIFPIVALLPFLVVVLLASILFSVHRDLSVLNTALVIILAQALIQYCYFFGVIARTVLPDRERAPRLDKDEARTGQ